MKRRRTRMPKFPLDLGQPIQNGLEFPATLAEKYRPTKVQDFVGLEGPKRILGGLLKQPRPCSLLFVGKQGVGKTAMGEAFAEQLPGTLHHICSQQCDVASLDRLWELCHYYPTRGDYHVVLVDEAAEMTDRAQLWTLSRLDGMADLKPLFGGGMERGEPLKIIWIFTCNGLGQDGTLPPYSLLPRFLSRNIRVPFALTPEEIAPHLRKVWRKEQGPKIADHCFDLLADGGGMRDALMRLQSELLAPRSIEQIQRDVEEAAMLKISADANPDQAQVRHLAAKKAWVTARSRGAASA